MSDEWRCGKCGTPALGDPTYAAYCYPCTTGILDLAQEREQLANAQIERLLAEVERLKGPTTCDHDPEYAGGACGICHAVALIQNEAYRGALSGLAHEAEALGVYDGKRAGGCACGSEVIRKYGHMVSCEEFKA